MPKRKATERPTLADVAARSAVSAITVSRYFNSPHRVGVDARARIEAAVEALGYVPNLAAGGLASARNKVVGMVVPNISGPIFAQMLQSLSDDLAGAGYQLLLSSSYFSLEAEERAVRAFLGWQPSALVLTSRHHSAGTERLIEAASLPVIETWDLSEDSQRYQVGFSHRQVGREGVRYLTQRGYNRIAFVHNSAAGDLSARERCEGYVEAVEALGGTPILYTPTEPEPLAAGAQALAALRESGTTRPDAIFFANDNLACGALLAAMRQGLAVPSEVALFGFGDYSFADKLLPSLSTIRPPARDIGTCTARHILALAQGQQPPRVTSLTCEVVSRESA